MQLIVGRPPRSVCNSHRSLRSYILHSWTAAPPPPPLPFWTGATFNPIANSIKTFPARTPFTSCKQCWNRSLVSIYSAGMFKSDQQISRNVQIDKNKLNIFFEIGINYIEYDWTEVIWCSIKKCIWSSVHASIIHQFSIGGIFISIDIEKYIGHLIKYCPK